MKLRLMFLTLFLSNLLSATVYTVKSAGGGNFTTISSCAGTAVAGDTCSVFAGTYTGWTQSTNGSAGNPITFTINASDSVTINSTVTISGRSYITISKFIFSGAGIVGDTSTQHSIIDHNTFNGNVSAFRIPDGGASTGSNNVVSNNTLTRTSTSINAVGIFLFGDSNLIAGNDISGGAGDCINAGGAHVVISNNYCHTIDGTIPQEHIDFVQEQGGGTTPTLTFSLVEGNKIQDLHYQPHLIIIRTGGSGTCPGSWSSANLANTVIVRYNFAQGMPGGSGASFGGSGDCVTNTSFYNNTIATENTGDNTGGNCASYVSAFNGMNANNICYNVAVAGDFPLGGYNGCGVTGLTGTGNGNLAFNTGYSGAWNGPYCGESTYNALKNQNPLFANYPTDGTLQGGSPAINAGVPITTVTSGCNSSSLTLANAHGFQDGWAGAQADWLRVGSSTTGQISSINYNTNVVTMTGSVSCTNGASVYLYKNSSGTVVLNGANPDVGAYPFGSSPPPSAPTLILGPVSLLGPVQIH